ncbi:MAG: TfoX/Sxy family protein [Anaerolineae bacterium]
MKAASQGKKAPPAMPAWTKAPAELVIEYKQLTAGYPQLEQRFMFGYPCAMVNGYLTVGVFGDHLFVRLDEGAAMELLAMPGAAQMEPSPGRIMAGYVLLPDNIRKAPEVHAWILQAINYSLSLPHKEKKKKGK